MPFDGVGGVATLERVEVVRASRAVTGDFENRRAPNVSLGKLTVGRYQISTNIPTMPVTVPPKREAFYVHRMSGYPYGIADDLTVPPVQFIIGLQEMRRRRI